MIEAGDDVMELLSRVVDAIVEFVSIFRPQEGGRRMYKPKAGDRVEFVGADGYDGVLQTGDRGRVKIDRANVFYAVWNSGYTETPPWHLCRLLDEEKEAVVYKPKAGDRIEFVGGYIGILCPGDRGTVTAGPLRPFVVWDNGRRTIPLWSLCRRLTERKVEEVVRPRIGNRVELLLNIPHADGSLPTGAQGTVYCTDDDYVQVLWDDGVLRRVKADGLRILPEDEEAAMSPMMQWERACRDFHMGCSDLDTLNNECARVLHWRHAELFPPEVPEIKGAVCPKCEYTEVALQYCDGRSSICFAIHGFEGEHVHYTCRRCEYEWLEACADAI